ncbi:amino acid adenylation domain-containing protein [Peribacillus simplex]|uniref:amino acid adenylation domain-containing protein n=1 Tax=Peribacillus simplex TaxID=1478 RepID=UPI003D2BD695
MEKNYYSLSHPQKRIWYNEQLYPETAIHHICGIGEISGKVQIPLLKKSIQEVIRKHQSFRLTLSERQNEQVQSFTNIQEPNICFIDFRTYPNPPEALNRWLEKQINEPLPVMGQPLYRFAVYQISDDRYGIFAKLHHLIFDGWSMRLVTNEISSNYEKLACGENISMVDENPYIKFIEREKRYLVSKRATKDCAYWASKFKELPEPLFPFDPTQLKAERKSYSLDSELTSSIYKWVNEHNCSINDFFILLVYLYLHKMYGRQEFTIATPVYNRSGTKEKQTIGMFTSTLPFLFNIDPNATVLEMLSSIKLEIRNSYLHQKYPFDLLIQDLQLKKQGNDPLFQLVVNYYPFVPDERMFGQRFNLTELHPGEQVFPLQIVIKEWAQGKLALEFDYQTFVFKDVDIENMSGRLLQLASLIMENSEDSIRDIQLITNEEKIKILEYNETNSRYPKDKTVVNLFEDQVKLTPERVALSCGSDSLTYRELHEKVSKLAGKLARLKIGPGSRVGVHGTHSMELIVGIMAILKSGASYVPIEHSHPAERIGKIVQDSCLSCIVVNKDLPVEVHYDGPILHLADLEGGAATFGHLVPIAPEDLAYMIYTSGSTGKPKGVMIEHSSLTNYCWWANKVYVQANPAVFAFYSSLSFDLTVTSIFTPLIGGHEIRVYQEPEEGFVLYDILRDNKVTVLKLTPAHLSLLKDQLYKNSSIQTLVVGGEKLKVSTAEAVYDQFGGSIKICNEYGPTEATIGCMIHTYDPRTDTGIAVPIGKPADNVQLHVLDEQLQLVPLGSIGELYISGAGVARGYWSNQDLTRNNFLSNPFQLDGKMYKTGDLVRFMDNGLMEYIGRKDKQVKINGFRIELEEIEAHLLRVIEIADAHVLDWDTKDGSKQLCAYLVTKGIIHISDLRAKLSESLPYYMVPVHFVMVDEIPLTTNGKVDRTRLPEPVIKHIEPSKEPYPFSEKEGIIAKTLQDILGVSSIGVAHDFFELGGDSIKAIQISSQLKKIGYNLKTKDILANPSIDKMVGFMESNENLRNSYEQGEMVGVLERSPIHNWFFEQRFEQPEYYLQSVMLRLDDCVKTNDIESAIQQLVYHHDILRLNVRPDTVLYHNTSYLDESFQLKAHDLSTLSYEHQLQEISVIGGKLKSEFNLETGLLIKAVNFDLGKHGKRLLIAAHHLVVDGVSWRILLDDLAKILDGKRRLVEIELPVKTWSYQRWTQEVKEYADSLPVEETGYWNEVTSHAARQLSGAPQDYQVLMQHTSTVRKNMSKETTKQWLLRTISAYQTEPVELLITSLAMTMLQMKGNSSVLMQMEGHGREEFQGDVDVSRTVGWFTSIFPVLLDLPDAELSVQIKQMKEQLRQVPNKGFEYLIKRYLNNQLAPISNEQQMIRFNYLGDFDGLAVPGFFALADEYTGPDTGPLNHFNVLLDFTAMVVKGQLHLSVIYGTSQFTEEWVTEFMDVWSDKLVQIVEHCANKKNTEYTPSDFDTVELDQEELDLLLMD